MDGANASTVFTDSSPVGNTLTASGTAQISTTQSKFGGASAIFGTSTANSISAGFSKNWLLGNQPFTFEFFCYPTAYNPYGGRIFSAAGCVAGNIGASFGNVSLNNLPGIHWFIQITAIGIQFSWWSGGSPSTGQSAVSPNLTVSLNTWTHVVFSFDGNNLYGFTNGVLQFTQAAVIPIPVTIPNLNIGAIIGEVSASAMYTGYIDEVRITQGYCRYTSTFTAPSVAFTNTISTPADGFYNNTVLLLHGDGTNGSTTITDSESTPKSPTVTGSATISTAQSVFGGSSINFTGSTDSVTVPTSTDFNFGSANFTVECWVFTNTAITTTQQIIGQWGTTNQYSWQLAIGVNNTIIINSSSTGSIVSTTSFTSPNNILNFGVWNYLIFSRNGTVFSLYANGFYVGSYFDNSALFSSTQPLIIGNNAASQPFVGYIDDIRVTKGYARYVQYPISPVLTSAAGSLINVLTWCLVNGTAPQGNCGWTRQTGTNIATYKQAGGNGYYLCVNDTNTGYAYVYGAETSSAAGSGNQTNLFPTAAQLAGGLCWVKTTSNNYSDWIVVATDRMVYFWVNENLSINVLIYTSLCWFGDIISYSTNINNPTDIWNTMIIGFTASGLTGLTTSTVSNYFPGIATSGHYIARSFTGLPTSSGSATVSKFVQQPIALGYSGSNTTFIIGGITPPISYPDVISNGAPYVGRIEIQETSTPVIRGYLPGAWANLTFPAPSLSQTAKGMTVTFTSGIMNGKTLEYLPSQRANGGGLLIETSNTW